MFGDGSHPGSTKQKRHCGFDQHGNSHKWSSEKAISQAFIEQTLLAQQNGTLSSGRKREQNQHGRTCRHRVKIRSFKVTVRCADCVDICRETPERKLNATTETASAMVGLEQATKTESLRKSLERLTTWKLKTACAFGEA